MTDKLDKIEETIRTYNNIVKEYEEFVNGIHLTEKVQFSKEMDFLVRNLDNNSKILDVGTAIGEHPKYLTEECNKGFEVYGIDSSENMIMAAKKNAPKANFDVVDMRRMKFAKEYFDAIICMGTLIHIDDEMVIKVLENFDAILKKNGLMIIDVMEYTGGKKEVYVVEPFNSKYHTYFNRYPKKFFRDWFTMNNYEILDIIDNPSSEEMKEIFTNQYSIIVRKK